MTVSKTLSAPEEQHLSALEDTFLTIPETCDNAPEESGQPIEEGFICINHPEETSFVFPLRDELLLAKKENLKEIRAAVRKQKSNSFFAQVGLEAFAGEGALQVLKKKTEKIGVDLIEPTALFITTSMYISSLLYVDMENPELTEENRVFIERIARCLVDCKLLKDSEVLSPIYSSVTETPVKMSEIFQILIKSGTLVRRSGLLENISGIMQDFLGDAKKSASLDFSVVLQNYYRRVLAQKMSRGVLNKKTRQDLRTLILAQEKKTLDSAKNLSRKVDVFQVFGRESLLEKVLSHLVDQQRGTFWLEFQKNPPILGKTPKTSADCLAILLAVDRQWVEISKFYSVFGREMEKAESFIKGKYASERPENISQEEYLKDLKDITGNAVKEGENCGLSEKNAIHLGELMYLSLRKLVVAKKENSENNNTQAQIPSQTSIAAKCRNAMLGIASLVAVSLLYVTDKRAQL
ncbi:uncharacterized protein NEMAJ01_1032 [Nematocida major]|uniref:uncharacterized protein n=1 Tax=Nematocida major TaxID=1912982 RepID=UPI0020079354|nr:uncharacterized protein NEMAJ01_1032 [Nematocida major]KAH9386136.1 hypothetical protein NEMAJ01_1032 [Nematocida major]